MKVKNLVCWSGTDFTAVPGDILDLPDATARDRIEAGLAQAIEPESKVKVKKDAASE